MTIAKGKPAITDGTTQFFNVTYEGNGGGQRVGKFIPFTDNGTISKSLIFDRASTPYLARTPSSTGNAKTFTFSCWFKKGNIDTSDNTNLPLLNAKGTSNEETFLTIGGDEKIRFDHLNSSGSTRLAARSLRTLEDRSKWYHIVLRVDTTQSDSDKIRIYIDGDLISIENTTYNDNEDTAMNTSSKAMQIGRHTTTSAYGDFYIAEVNHCDGQSLAPSTFGLTDTSTGRWIPKSLGSITYGTNGFRMQFANSAGQTIGDDTSGNTNDFTVNNIATTDIVTDSPTQNFATGFHNQSDNGTLTMSEGNLRAAQGSGTSDMSTMRSTLTLDPNDPNLYYCEVKVITEQGGNGITAGISDVRADGVKMSSSTLKFGVGTNYMFACDTYVVIEQNGADAGTGNDSTRNPEFTDGDYIGIAFQAGKVWIAKNNTWSNSGNPTNGTGYLVDLPKDTLYRFVNGQYGPSGGCISEINFGQKSFNYTPPTGAKNLQQDNLPSAGKDFADLVWIKNRDATDNHQVYDSTRGPQKDIHSNALATESTTTDGLQKFLNGGFAIEDDVSVNTVGESYVAWNWHAAGGTTSANSDGSGATLASTIQANQTAGFSIVTYTGDATAGRKVAHGLSQAPEWLWIQSRSLSTGGKIYHHKNTAAPATDYLALTGTDATFDSAWLNDTAPDSSCFTIGGTGVATNNDDATYVAYCWHSVAGYSKFGSYTGNGNADGTFIMTGFKPAWIMIKRTNSAANWYIDDTARNPINPTVNTINADTTTAESGNANLAALDILSNGFKNRQGAGTGINDSGSTYIYMAFAEHPFIGDGTNPATAR